MFVMAKGSVNVAAQCSSLIAKIEAGEFSPIYLLMGDEPYYLDLICNSVIEHSLDEFSRDFNELETFDGLFSDDVYNAINKLFFLPFKDKKNPLIFVLVELDDDDDITLAEASETAVTLKNIVEFKNQERKILAKLDTNIDKGLEISESRLYILSLDACIEQELEGVEVPGNELRALVKQAITDNAQMIVAPLFRAPNCSHSGSNGEIKVVLFAKDEEDEQLLAYHISRTLTTLLGREISKNVLFLSAGLCPNKKGTIAFLRQG